MGRSFGIQNEGRWIQPVAVSNSRDADAGPLEDEVGGEATLRSGQDALSVVKVDMSMQNNKSSHYTSSYANDSLIIRRGQEFQIALTFSRPLIQGSDNFQLEFLIGSSPSAIDGSLNIATFGNRGGNWAGRVIGQEGSSVLVGVTSAPNSIVGRFQMFVAVSGDGGMHRTNRDSSTDVYILFNAWAREDTVYYPNDSERSEYVLNDNGVIYQGSADSVSYKYWNYGQFERGVLDACIYIMDASRIPISDRGNVVKVGRMAAAMLNSQDDNGVLIGNWSDSFSGGTPPTSWSGSPAILQRYASSRMPVGFAQCWVYAGCFNTFLRCLGIPSRIISNYNSAHDSGGNLETNLIFTNAGTLDMRNSIDSIWNYHCWNEAYMTRPDLPPGLEGWQVVDCTPQETSDGYYRCGPCSLKAIKEGQLGYQFDGLFIFAEVNSDLVVSKMDKYGVLTPSWTDTTYIGALIYTKAVGSDSPVNVTNNYKYAEGSSQDHASVARAKTFARNRSDFQDVVMATLTLEPVELGKDFEVTVDFVNNSPEVSTIRALLVGSMLYYTGVKAGHFKQHTLELTINSQVSMLFELMGLADKQPLHVSKLVPLQLPALILKLSGTAKVKSEMFVKVEFTNTLPIALENVTVSMEGSGMLPYITKYYPSAPVHSYIRSMTQPNTLTLQQANTLTLQQANT
ncbi:coagulation factor XIII A chain-like [Aplochiton taeniatus]